MPSPIALSEATAERIRQRALSKGFATPEEYLAALVAEDERQEREAQSLRADVQLGIADLDRGAYTEYDDQSLPDLVAVIEEEGRRLLQTRRGQQSK